MLLPSSLPHPAWAYRHRLRPVGSVHIVTRCFWVTSRVHAVPNGQAAMLSALISGVNVDRCKERHAYKIFRILFHLLFVRSLYPERPIWLPTQSCSGYAYRFGNAPFNGHSARRPFLSAWDRPRTSWADFPLQNSTIVMMRL